MEWSSLAGICLIRVEIVKTATILGGVQSMPLTPLDIHNKQFSRSFRGYNEEEVNEFLDQIIKDLELIIKEKKKVEEENEELREKLSHFSNIEESLSKSILVAQETAEEVKANAKKEAQLIVKEAEKMPIALSTTPWLKRGKSPSKSTSSNAGRRHTSRAFAAWWKPNWRCWNITAIGTY